MELRVERKSWPGKIFEYLQENRKETEINQIDFGASKGSVGFNQEKTNKRKQKEENPTTNKVNEIEMKKNTNNGTVMASIKRT